MNDDDPFEHLKRLNPFERIPGSSASPEARAAFKRIAATTGAGEARRDLRAQSVRRRYAIVVAAAVATALTVAALVIGLHVASQPTAGSVRCYTQTSTLARYVVTGATSRPGRACLALWRSHLSGQQVAEEPTVCYLQPHVIAVFPTSDANACRELSLKRYGSK